MILEEKIQQLRKEAGLSQEMLAGQLGVSRQAVSKWELGEATPDIDKIIKLSQLFEVSTDYLLLNEGTDKDKTNDLKLDDKKSKSDTDNIDERKETVWYEQFLGKWVKVFLDDESFGGFYEIAIIAIDQEYLMFHNTKDQLGIVSIRNIKSISEADIYSRRKKAEDIPTISLRTFPDGYNMLQYFVGKQCKIHLECKSLFRSPGSFYKSEISDITEDSILITYKKQKSVIKKNRILAIIEW